VSVLLKRASVDAIASEDYDLAERLEQAAAGLREHLRAVDRDVRAELAAKRRADAVEELRGEQAEWDGVLHEFREEQQRLREEMLERHADELAMYERKWAEDGALVPFSKSSPELLTMRKMQKALALAKQFQDAKDVKRRVKQRQQQETREAEVRAIAAMKAGYENLGKRQNREMQCFDEHHNRNVEYIEAERARAIEPLVMRLRAIDTGCADGGPPIMRTDRKTNYDRPRIDVVSPRTRAKLWEFRESDAPGRLSLDLQNVTRFATRKGLGLDSRKIRETRVQGRRGTELME
jgi:hypothetical protein